MTTTTITPPASDLAERSTALLLADIRRLAAWTVADAEAEQGGGPMRWGRVMWLESLRADLVATLVKARHRDGHSLASAIMTLEARLVAER